MNEFGGNWTLAKMDIFIKYAQAYLKIMNSQIINKSFAKNWKLAYFDGFAGSGSIKYEEKEETQLKIDNLDKNIDNLTKGTATRILELETEKKFDKYVFVESNGDFANELQENIKNKFPEELSKICEVYPEDFNIASENFAKFLKGHKEYKCLTFIDPFGMNAKWISIENFKHLSIDLWLLIPTGVGVNRLLKKDGQIDEKNFEVLSSFFGKTKEEIEKYFYTIVYETSLFEDETTIRLQKEKKSVEKIHKFYKENLLNIFKYVSDAFVMKNSNKSIMYHFLLASNNLTAINIANDIVGKESGLQKL